MKIKIPFFLSSFVLAILLLAGCENITEDTIAAREGTWESEDGYIISFDEKEGIYTLKTPNGRIGTGNYMEGEDSWVVDFGDTEYGIKDLSEGFLLYAIDEEYNESESLDQITFDEESDETLKMYDPETLTGVWTNASGSVLNITVNEETASLNCDYSYLSTDGTTTVEGSAEITDGFDGKGYHFCLSDIIYMIPWEDGSIQLDFTDYDSTDTYALTDEQGQEYAATFTNEENRLMDDFYLIDESYEGYEEISK